MLDNIKQVYENITTPIKRNKSFFYYIVSFIIVVTFIFFFNSQSILPDDAQIFNTPIGKEVDMGSTKLVIKSWEYNKAENFMEVELSYLEADDSLGTNFKFSARPEVNTQLNLPVKIVISNDDTYIIHIENIPKNYEAISLKVTQGTSVNSSVNYVTSDDFNTVSNTENNSNDTSSVNVYCDYRKVEVNNNLKGKTKKGYLMDITNTEINTSKSNIITIDKTIEDNKKLIVLINNKIADLNSQLKYEIDSEQKKTMESIDSYNAKIQQINSTNSDLEDQKSTEQEKIKKFQQELKDLSKK
jgi:hypothetical protein